MGTAIKYICYIFICLQFCSLCDIHQYKRIILYLPIKIRRKFVQMSLSKSSTVNQIVEQKDQLTHQSIL